MFCILMHLPYSLSCYYIKRMARVGETEAVRYVTIIWYIGVIRIVSRYHFGSRRYPW